MKTNNYEMWRKFRDELAKIIGCAWYQSTLLLMATDEQKTRAWEKVKK